MSLLFFATDLSLGAALLLSTRYRYGTFRNAVSFFSVLWMIVAAAANLGPLFGYYEVSVYVNLALIVGAITFSLIMFVFPVDYGKIGADISSLAGFSDVKIRLVLLTNAVCFLIMLPLIGNAINTIISDGWTYLRGAFYSPDNQNMSTIQTYLLQYVVNPCRTATIILGFFLIIGRRRRGFMVLTAGIINAVAYSVISAGRGALLTVIYYAIWSLLIDYQFGARYLSKFLRVRYILPIAFACVAVLAITSGRSSSSDTFISVLYKNYCIGPILLTQLLSQRVVGFVPDVNFMLGWASFGFIFNIPLTIGLVFGLGTKTSDYWISSYLTSGNLMIGANQYSNALSTCYYTFIMDWGTLGIVIGPALVALASVAIIQKQKKEKSVFWTGILLLWIDVLFHTITGWELLGITFFCEIFFLYVFAGIKKSCSVNK